MTSIAFTPLWEGGCFDIFCTTTISEFSYTSLQWIYFTSRGLIFIPMVKHGSPLYHPLGRGHPG